ncbi:MAG: type II toxin-antitoxin system VapC family toxin [Rectinema subterraneum]|uniref:type II toxin-antitoxin system VapC family toxin n=1 Tax=Rectinema subterraneum TaxID=2653714 RepID=UPI003C7C4E59
MNIVDSSCWLEYFAGTTVGDEVAPIIEDTENLLVSSITIFEVFKKLLQELDEDKALFAIAHMKQGNVMDLDTDGAIFAAKTAKEYKLPMADSIIYAATQKYDAQLWTQDKHFQNLPSVHYFEKQF